MRETDDPATEETEGAVRIHPVRWNAEEWKLLERAAEVFGEREHMSKTTPTDIIRSGALRRAEEILGVATQ